MPSLRSSHFLYTTCSHYSSLLSLFFSLSLSLKFSIELVSQFFDGTVSSFTPHFCASLSAIFMMRSDNRNDNKLNMADNLYPSRCEQNDPSFLHISSPHQLCPPSLQQNQQTLLLLVPNFILFRNLSFPMYLSP